MEILRGMENMLFGYSSRSIVLCQLREGERVFFIIRSADIW